METNCLRRLLRISVQFSSVQFRPEWRSWSGNVKGWTSLNVPDLLASVTQRSLNGGKDGHRSTSQIYSRQPTTDHNGGKGGHRSTCQIYSHQPPTDHNGGKGGHPSTSQIYSRQSPTDHNGGKGGHHIPQRARSTRVSHPQITMEERMDIPQRARSTSVSHPQITMEERMDIAERPRSTRVSYPQAGIEADYVSYPPHSLATLNTTCVSSYYPPCHDEFYLSPAFSTSTFSRTYLFPLPWPWHPVHSERIP